MKPPYSDHPEGVRKHATVAVAMTRVLALVRGAGIPGFVDSEKFDEEAESKGSLFFKWHQGWSTTEDYEVTMRVDIELTSSRSVLDGGLVPLSVRMQWPYDGKGDLATRTAVLDLATQVNHLSARVLSEVRGLFIIDEDRYDQWCSRKAKEAAEQEKKRKEAQAEKKRGRRRRK